MNEYIAYNGDSFLIEWYYDDNGKSQPLVYYKSLSVDERIKILRLFKRIGDVGVIKDKKKFNYEGDKIYAFKPQPDRFLCFFFDGHKIIVTNAFRKKRQKLPPGEKAKAIRNQESYILRMNQGDYYEEN